MRARLAKLGPYPGEDAVKEAQQALLDAGDRLWDVTRSAQMRLRRSP